MVAPFPLAISTSVFARAFSPAHIDALDESTVDGVEIVGPSPQCPFDQPDVADALRARFRDARVRLHSVHLPYGSKLDVSQSDDALRAAALSQTEANLRTAAALGARLMVVHPSAEPIADEERAARLDASRRSLATLTATAADLGVRLAVECLPRSCLGHTAVELLSIVDDLDPRVTGVCIDANHLNLRDDLAAGVRTLGRRLFTLHCSENDGIDERHWLPGSAGGVIDWNAFLGALRDVRYAGPFLYELRTLDLDVPSTLRAIEDNYRGLIANAEA
ncbi:MAG TPA: sugar phosphate isomerase/epimerase family protein [Chloroflexota bacterium]|nr:sugar phosphate isomerase/epimerase family protein [Chloroflexota bacterium]